MILDTAKEVQETLSSAKNVSFVFVSATLAVETIDSNALIRQHCGW